LVQPFAQRPTIPPEVLAALPTPCMVVDLPLVDQNIGHAVDLLAGTGITLRPHFKAHKCTTLMLRQLAAGASGATVQTAWEALVLADQGVDDILVANQIVDPTALGHLAEAAGKTTLTATVDSIRHVELLDELASRLAVRLNVVIELDVGSARCGVVPGEPALLEVADAVAASSGLMLAGILAYEGHLSLREPRSARRRGLVQVASTIRSARESLEAGGHEVRLVTGGSTGTLELLAASGTHNEAQPGSYVLMDSAYQRIGVPFRQAAFCAARVVSLRDDSLVLDVGLKEMAVDHGMPVPVDPGLRITGLSDEHARVVATGPVGYHIGDVVLVVPSHIDPTVNLQPSLHVWTGTTVEEWLVDGRRPAHQTSSRELPVER
jgi:D-serine deaminase-like pyridoxal phosphate-dependent protein